MANKTQRTDKAKATTEQVASKLNERNKRKRQQNRWNQSTRNKQNESDNKTGGTTTTAARGVQGTARRRHWTRMPTKTAIRTIDSGDNDDEHDNKREEKRKMRPCHNRKQEQCSDDERCSRSWIWADPSDSECLACVRLFCRPEGIRMVPLHFSVI